MHSDQSLARAPPRLARDGISVCFFCADRSAEGDHVPRSDRRTQQALDRGWIQETRLEEVLELQIFTRANEQLGSGESACIALAEARNWVLGTDDSKGTKWKRVISAPGIRILNTPGILLLAIRQKVLTVQQADEIKTVLEENRFRMGFNSFQDLVNE